MKIKKGVEKKPHLICVYGQSAVGKTTFASKFSRPLFICAENGLGEIGSDRVEISTMKELDDVIKSNLTAYDTLVIDSLDWLESIIYRDMMARYGVDTLTKCGGGYGAYVGIALAIWQDLIRKLNDLRNDGKNIVLIAHYQIKAFNDPASESPYDKYQLKLQDRVSSLIKEWVDVLLFASFEIFVNKAQGMQKNKAVSTGERIAHVKPNAAFDAKTRFKLPDSFEFSYDAFVKAFNQNDQIISNEMVMELGLLLSKCDDETREKAQSYLSVNTSFEACSVTIDRLKELTKGTKNV
ncbi:MAG: ATP-binding protein [Patescibacteria group bacterium]